ncbi:hypothetical protein B0O40_0663 [Ruminococcaceae bacterium R-25]|nr:hypothetical protein B0O40_0663 [Ruminococcaceae bacterium R-25]SUQ11293.1 hypothetical protein SAMN06297423_0663 [Oscillospiraceae bacterium]
MIMKKPEADIIRFSSSDVVAASSIANTMMWAGFGDGTPKNGTVSYDGQTYTIDSDASIDSLYNAMSALGVKSSTKIDDGAGEQRMKTILGLEVTKEEGVGSKRWNGTYIYENGMFTKKA